MHLINFRFEGVFRVWPLPCDEFGNQVAKCFLVYAVPRDVDPPPRHGRVDFVGGSYYQVRLSLQLISTIFILHAAAHTIRKGS